jgi:hypothetical protein
VERDKVQQFNYSILALILADKVAAMRIVAVVISVQVVIQGYCLPKFKEF